MANLNKVFLIGNLTRDPELRYTPGGMAVAEFGLAVNRRRTGQDGEKRDEVCFVDIIAWGRQGEVISEYCRKGRPLFVEGRLTLDTWEGRDGQKRSRMRVTVENFQFLGGQQGRADGAGAEERGESAPPPPRPPRATPRPPAPPPPRGEAPPPEGGDEVPPDADYKVDDDIPF